MKNNSSQIQPVDASAPAFLERVSVAMAEIAVNMQEGLLALAVGGGPAVHVGADGGRRDRAGRPEGPPRCTASPYGLACRSRMRSRCPRVTASA
jgi:hypothetical protein